MAATVIVPVLGTGTLVRRPSGTNENQVLVNQGPGPVILQNTATVPPLLGSGAGLLVPKGSRLTLLGNGSPVYATAGATVATGVTTPEVPASAAAVTNSTGRAVAVAISGGTVTSVQVGPSGSLVTVATSSGVTVIVPAGQQIAITYSTAPTWVWQTGVPANLMVTVGTS